VSLPDYSNESACGGWHALSAANGVRSICNPHRLSIMAILDRTSFNLGLLLLASFQYVCYLVMVFLQGVRPSLTSDDDFLGFG
jgi:hypothetical protein